MNLERLKKQLTIDEGRKNKPYLDTVNKITIGVGRNLSDRGISDDEIDLLLQNDIRICIEELQKNLPFFDSLDDVRQEVLVNMCFNMGWPTLKTFKLTLGYIAAGDYMNAGYAMKQSLWAKQVGQRAERLAYAMREGKFQ